MKKLLSILLILPSLSWANMAEDAERVAHKVAMERTICCVESIHNMVRQEASSGNFSVSIDLRTVIDGLDCSPYEAQLLNYLRNEGFNAYEPWASVGPIIRLSWRHR